MKPVVASRVAWGFWAGNVGISLAAVTFLILSFSTSPPAETFGFRGLSLLLSLTFGTMGALVASKRPNNAIGWIYLAIGAIAALQELGFEYAVYTLLHVGRSSRLAEAGAWLGNWSWVPMIMLLGPFTFHLMPTGRPLSKFWNWVLWATAVGVVIPSVGLALAPGQLEEFPVIDNPFGIDRPLIVAFSEVGISLLVLAIAASLVALVVRFRRSTGDERQQLKWFIAPAGFVLFAIAIGVTSTVTGFLDSAALEYLIILSIVTVPFAVGIGILRYRLYDIDLVIKKTLVYGALVVFITGIYLSVVIGIGSLIGGRANLPLSIAATALIAVGFQPLRSRAQTFANRVVYGERVSPYEAMAEFSHQMAGVPSVEEVLPRMAETAAKGIGATKARVRVFLPDGTDRASSWPIGSAPDSFDRTISVRYGDDEVGEISVTKDEGEAIAEAEERLLRDLASQAGLALRNVRLNEELRASLQRVVTAQDEERRRMERDIHDGAQQQLVSMAVKLGLLKNLMSKDPEKASTLVEEVKLEAGQAVETLRDLARGLFPPVLTERGLEAALRSHAEKAGVDVDINTTPSALRFDPKAEAAVYFAIREALQNASKHAPNAQISISLTHTDGVASFHVRDNGPGFEVTKAKRGSGLQNMRDRIEALGGKFVIDSTPGVGTHIGGSVPVSAGVANHALQPDVEATV